MTKNKALVIFKKYLKCYYDQSDWCNRNCDHCNLKYSEEEFKSAVELMVERMEANDDLHG